MTIAQTSSTSTVPRFGVGRVLARSVDLLILNFFRISALTALVAVAGSALNIVVIRHAARPLAALAGGPAAPAVISLVILVLGTFMLLLAAAVIAHAVLQSLRGLPVRLLSSLSAAGSRIGAILLLALLCAVAIGLGRTMLVVPGLIVSTFCFVAVPACVIERCSPIESLIRSLELTKGHRWAIFGLLAVIWIANSAGNSVVQRLAIDHLDPLIGNGAVLGWSMLYMAFSAIAMTVAYHDLRVEKEAGEVERIVEMFA